MIWYVHKSCCESCNKSAYEIHNRKTHILSLINKMQETAKLLGSRFGCMINDYYFCFDSDFILYFSQKHTSEENLPYYMRSHHTSSIHKADLEELFTMEEHIRIFHRAFSDHLNRLAGKDNIICVCHCKGLK